MLEVSYAEFGWAQWVMVLLSLLNLWLNAAKHGQLKPESLRTFSLSKSALDQSVLYLLLIFGGFF